jgi:hypothetical protein
VLLGDVVELRHEPVATALDAARAVLEEIGAALPADAEVVLVPGNHDHQLLSDFLQRRAAAGPPEAFGLETPVDWRLGEPLAAVASALGPDRTRACYPGAWLRDDVYATHGHFADRHTTVPMLERLAAGVMAMTVGEPGSGPQRIEDYEATLAPVYAWIHAVAQTGGALGRGSQGASARAWQALGGGGDRAREPPLRRGRRALARRGLTAGFPLLIAGLNRAGVGPLRASLAPAELRRASLLALAEVLTRLQVEADHVIFGHTHRAGPLDGDHASEWRGDAGQRLVNTGSWIDEPAFLGPRPQQSPYRGGFCVRVGPDGRPELRNLLDPARSRAPA